MLKLKRLEKKDLEIYRDKKVVFVELKTHHLPVIDVFKALKIEVIACYVENISIENFIALKLCGIKIIKPHSMELFLKKHDDIIFQCVHEDKKSLQKWKEVAAHFKVAFSDISAMEIVSSFSYLTLFKNIKHPVRSFIIKLYWHYSCNNKSDENWRCFKKRPCRTPIICCLPTKTADVTICRTLQSLEMKKQNENATVIVWTNVWHKPRFINKATRKKFSKFKIIVGLREPISQNLSAFYQSVAVSTLSYNWIYGLLWGQSRKEQRKIIDACERLATKHGFDVQLLWDAFLYRYLFYKHEPFPSVAPSTIQEFMLEFEKHVLDITAYPFDKEKGYTIINCGNTDVFIYQLEKLNSLVPELSAWIGVPFDKLENGNQASEKWIAESYKQAQGEIKITQEYFDRCFNEPYVKHCYSEADIEKFKARWRLHIEQL